MLPSSSGLPGPRTDSPPLVRQGLLPWQIFFLPNSRSLCYVHNNHWRHLYSSCNPTRLQLLISFDNIPNHWRHLYSSHNPTRLQLLISFDNIHNTRLCDINKPRECKRKSCKKKPHMPTTCVCVCIYSTHTHMIIQHAVEVT